jgi:hypothetical protein
MANAVIIKELEAYFPSVLYRLIRAIAGGCDVQDKLAYVGPLTFQLLYQ